MQLDDDVKHHWRRTALSYLAFTITPIHYGYVLILLRQYVEGPPISIVGLEPDTALLRILAVVFSVTSFGELAFARFMPRLLIREYKKRGAGPGLSCRGIITIQATAYSGIALFGFVLGLLGAGWVVILPFLVIALVGFIVNFPTKKRFQALLEKVD